MQTKRFVAADMRRALSLVRDDLGEDAMILSTQRTSKGVEIIATAEDISPQPIKDNANSTDLPKLDVASEQNQGTKVGLASGKTQDELAEELNQARNKMLSMQGANNDNITLTEWANLQPSSKPTSLIGTNKNQNIEIVQENNQDKNSLNNAEWLAIQKQQNEKANGEIERLHKEIAMMRTAFQDQLLAMSEAQQRQFQDQKNQQDIIPIAAHVKQQLSHIGLTQACNDQVIRSLRSVDDKHLNEESLLSESYARLSKHIPILDSDPVSEGGFYAFFGTTGVGKTTTIAKLAARYVIKHGPENVVLVTTDTLRIGATDQLCSLGRILNVRVKVVDDLAHLPSLLSEFSKESLVLIDTPGMSVNNPLLHTHLTVLRQCPVVKTSLVLAATSQYQTMQATLHSYRSANLRFCVMTKLDECASLGGAISLLTSNDLALAYITDGQSVPDDLSTIKSHQLVSKAVSLSQSISEKGKIERSFNISKNPA